ncbi:hypothetical protein BJX96DRAFT_23709 [Aspergillus floccosus]
MPLSSRSKKSRKDGGNRTSTASVLSMNSHSTSKASQSSVGKSKNETLPLQPAISKSNIAAATETERKAPNVFEYLDDDDDSDSDLSSDTSSEEEDGSHPAPTTSTTQSKTTAYSAPGRTTGSSTNAESSRSRTSSMWSKNSLDSHTFSTLETSPSSAPLQLARNNSNHPRKASMDTSYGTVGSLVSTSSHPRKQSLDFTSVPEARKPRSSHVPSGYGLLTWRLSSSTTDSKEPRLPPLYRRFEDLNHRVLLHLQDEISQMEEDLRVLDDYEEMHRVSTAEQEGSKKMPASRRMDVQAQVYSSLHYRREEVMGQLTHKIEQYNNALSAYSKVLQTLPSASEQDVTTYRSWMRKHTPIIAAETRFLDYAKDLVSLTPRPAAAAAAATAPSAMTPVYSAIVIASAAILLPLLAFSMISEFSGRLLVVAVVGGAAAAIASNYSTGADGLVGSQDGWRCATLYFGFMTVAAMFIP